MDDGIECEKIRLFPLRVFFILRRCELESSRIRTQDVRKLKLQSSARRGKTKAILRENEMQHIERWEATISRLNLLEYPTSLEMKAKFAAKFAASEMSRFCQFSPLNHDFPLLIETKNRKKKRERRLKLSGKLRQDRKGKRFLFSDFLLFLQRTKNV